MIGRVAPHEGREIDLVIAGSKPLAVIEKRKDPEQYARSKRLPAQGLVRFYRIGPEGAEVIISKSAQRANAYIDALNMPDGEDKTRVMGVLFGYSEADIEAFITNPPACDCSKCKRIGKIWTGTPPKYGKATDAARRTQFHAK